MQLRVLVRFLTQRNLPMAEQILNFKSRAWKTSWQTPNQGNNCGVYVMITLREYKAASFMPGLEKAKMRDYYRAEIAGELIVSDLNVEKRDVLRRVHQFRNERDQALVLFRQQKYKEAAEKRKRQQKKKPTKSKKKKKISDEEEEEET